eukprot:Colp12_sorted_trinity150504_noHs@7881
MPTTLDFEVFSEDIRDISTGRALQEMEALLQYDDKTLLAALAVKMEQQKQQQDRQWDFNIQRIQSRKFQRPTQPTNAGPNSPGLNMGQQFSAGPHHSYMSQSTPNLPDQQYVQLVAHGNVIAQPQQPSYGGFYESTPVLPSQGTEYLSNPFNIQHAHPSTLPRNMNMQTQLPLSNTNPLSPNINMQTQLPLSNTGFTSPQEATFLRPQVPTHKRVHKSDSGVQNPNIRMVREGHQLATRMGSQEKQKLRRLATRQRSRSLTELTIDEMSSFNSLVQEIRSVANDEPMGPLDYGVNMNMTASQAQVPLSPPVGQVGTIPLSSAPLELPNFVDDGRLTAKPKSRLQAPQSELRVPSWSPTNTSPLKAEFGDFNEHRAHRPPAMGPSTPQRTALGPRRSSSLPELASWSFFDEDLEQLIAQSQAMPVETIVANAANTAASLADSLPLRKMLIRLDSLTLASPVPQPQSPTEDDMLPKLDNIPSGRTLSTHELAEHVDIPSRTSGSTIKSEGTPMGVDGCDFEGSTIRLDDMEQPTTSSTTTTTARHTFVCEWEGCGKRYTKQSHLAAHQRVHTGEKPFTCELCGETFQRSDQMTRHKRWHTGEKPYSCDVCGKSFARADHLRTHAKTHFKGLM